MKRIVLVVSVMVVAQSMAMMSSARLVGRAMQAAGRRTVSAGMGPEARKANRDSRKVSDEAKAVAWLVGIATTTACGAAALK